MFYNQLYEQFKALSTKANELAGTLDNENDKYYHMTQDPEQFIADCDTQLALCKKLDEEWSVLEEAIEQTRAVINALNSYYEFSQKHEELVLV